MFPPFVRGGRASRSARLLRHRTRLSSLCPPLSPRGSIARRRLSRARAHHGPRVLECLKSVRAKTLLIAREAHQLQNSLSHTCTSHRWLVVFHVTRPVHTTKSKALYGGVRYLATFASLYGCEIGHSCTRSAHRNGASAPQLMPERGRDVFTHARWTPPRWQHAKHYQRPHSCLVCGRGPPSAPPGAAH